MKPWFKLNSSGFGWTPASWQGWCLLSAYCLLVLRDVVNLAPITPQRFLSFLLEILLMTGIFVFICYQTAGKRSKKEV